jgi:hypothetical protein
VEPCSREPLSEEERNESCEQQRTQPIPEPDQSNEMGEYSDDSFQRKMQTMMWCASIPNHKKKIENMKMIFVGGYAKFVPK